jgi:hypothetical protein
MSACSRHSVLPPFQRETFDAYEFCNSKFYVVASLSGILNIPCLATKANDLVTVHALLLVHVLLPQAGTFPVMLNQFSPCPYPIESSLFSKDCKLIPLGVPATSQNFTCSACVLLPEGLLPKDLSHVLSRPLQEDLLLQ